MCEGEFSLNKSLFDCHYCLITVFSGVQVNIWSIKNNSKKINLDSYTDQNFIVIAIQATIECDSQHVVGFVTCHLALQPSNFVYFF